MSLQRRIDYSDYYCTYAIHTRMPVYMPDGGEDFVVMCCIPDTVDTKGNISPDTCYLSIVVVPADYHGQALSDYFAMLFAGFGIFAHQQIGSMRRVKSA